MQTESDLEMKSHDGITTSMLNYLRNIILKNPHINSVRLGSLNNRYVFSHSPGGQSEVKVLAGLAPGENSLLGWQGVLTGAFLCVHFPGVSSAYKDTNPVRSGSNPYDII